MRSCNSYQDIKTPEDMEYEERVDSINYKDFNNWLDYAKIMSISKYYGCAFGFYKNMKFEVIPSYNHTTNKSNVYLILYK